MLEQKISSYYVELYYKFIIAYVTTFNNNLLKIKERYLSMNNQIIHKANQFLTKFSLNRYVKKPLYKLDLSQEGINDYLETENLSIGVNQLNPFVSLHKLDMYTFLTACFNLLNTNNVTIFNQEEDELIEIIMYIYDRQLENELMKELQTLSELDFRTFDGILNCLSIQREDIPLGDQTPLASFLQAYLCLIDKDKATNNLMRGDV